MSNSKRVGFLLETEKSGWRTIKPIGSGCRLGARQLQLKWLAEWLAARRFAWFLCRLGMVHVVFGGWVLFGISCTGGGVSVLGWGGFLFLGFGKCICVVNVNNNVY